MPLGRTLSRDHGAAINKVSSHRGRAGSLIYCRHGPRGTKRLQVPWYTDETRDQVVMIYSHVGIKVSWHHENPVSLPSRQPMLLGHLKNLAPRYQFTRRVTNSWYQGILESISGMRLESGRPCWPWSQGALVSVDRGIKSSGASVYSGTKVPRRLAELVSSHIDPS